MSVTLFDRPAARCTFRPAFTNALRGALDNSGTVIFDATGSTTLFEVLSGTGEYIMRNTGTLNLNATGVSHDLSGKFTLESGTVNFGGEDGAGIRLQYAQFNKTGGTVNFAGAADFTFGSLEGTSGLALQTAAANAINLNVGGNDKSTTFSGVLSGAGSLTVLGDGTMTLTEVNTFEGGTTVAAGTLALGANGTLGTGGLMVAAGATVDATEKAEGLALTGADAILGGTGTVKGDLELTAGRLAFSAAMRDNTDNALVMDGGRLSFGHAGKFTVGDLILADGTVIDWDSVEDGVYTLVTGDVNFDTVDTSHWSAGFTDGRYAYFENQSLSLVVIPEPAALGMMLVAMAGMLGFRRLFAR